MELQPLRGSRFGSGFLQFRFRAPILPAFAFILGSSCREMCSCRQLIEVLGALAAQRALCRGRSETKSLSLVTLRLGAAQMSLLKEYPIESEQRIYRLNTRTHR